MDADNILESANATALDAWEAFTNRTSLIENITSISLNNQQELEALNSSIGSLQQQLERALQAAASVSAQQIPSTLPYFMCPTLSPFLQIELALRFYGNSSNSFSIPVEATSSPSHSTTISMLFRPEEVSSGLMLATDVGMNQTNEGVALRVRDGSVHFEYRSSSEVVSLNVSSIREEQWYHLYASV